jgi:hypothetical protein
VSKASPSVVEPAFYTQPAFIKRPRLRDWWAILHPPYTLCHLSFVVIGACLTGPVNSFRLWMTVIAFFVAVGLGSHALDELQGRPLRTSIPSWQLRVVGFGGVGVAVGIGIVGAIETNALLSVFILLGIVFALSYNLELFHSRLHTGLSFALSWGAFPVLTAYFAQHAALNLAAFVAAAFGGLIAAAQRQLSTPARNLRRRVTRVEGVEILHDGTRVAITRESLLAPLESALKLLCWASVALAGALALARYNVF